MATSITLEISTEGGRPAEFTTLCPNIRIGQEGEGELDALMSRLSGRSEERIRVSDPAVKSVRRIFVLPEGAYIVDEHPDEGTKLNGKKVKVPAPIKAGDVITMGRTRIVVKALDLSAKLDLDAFPPRYVSVRVLDECPSCGQPQPMNGPRLQTPCASCGKTTNTEPGYFTTFLRHADSDAGFGDGPATINMTTKVWLRAEPPACSHCAAPLPVESVAVGTDGPLLCPACGSREETFQAPDWLTAEIPSARQIYCCERAPAAPGASAAPLTTAGTKPIALACPQCKGALSLTEQSKRTMVCEYCGASVFLPDQLWRELHPVPEARPWFVRFQGPRGNVEAWTRKAREDFEEIRQRMMKEPPPTFLKRLGGLIWVMGVGLGLLTAVGGIVVAAIREHNAGDLDRPELVGAQARLGATAFSIEVPAGYAMREQYGTIHWYDPGRGEEDTSTRLEIQVREGLLPGSVEKMRGEESGPFEYWEPTRAVKLEGGGYELHTREKDGEGLEVHVHRPNGGEGMSLLCTAIVNAFGAELRNEEEIDAYAARICLSMTPAP